MLKLEELQTKMESIHSEWHAGDTDIVKAAGPDELGVGLGYRPPKPEDLQLRQSASSVQSRFRLALAASASEHCPAIDWRKVNGDNYLSKIRHQGTCGSCVAFGTSAVVEAMFRIGAGNPNHPIDISEAELFYCLAGAGVDCETGWDIPPALELFKKPGVHDEPYFPYSDSAGGCHPTGTITPITKITSYVSLNTPNKMKRWLCDHGPLVTAMAVYEDFQYYTSGIYARVDGQLLGGHCVCCVGFDDNDGYWICRNSWGTGWGEKGYFRIAYGQVGIDAEMFGVNGAARLTASP